MIGFWDLALHFSTEFDPVLNLEIIDFLTKAYFVSFALNYFAKNERLKIEFSIKR